MIVELAALLVRADDGSAAQHLNQIRVGLVMIANQAASLKAMEACDASASMPMQEDKASCNNPPVTTQHSSTVSNMRFSNIVGSDAAKQALYENIILPMTADTELRQKLFQGVRSGIGNVLLYGPPGNGKTLLAQATAGESSATLFCVRPSDVLSKYHGESERFLSRLFEAARQVDRAVIFLDEFDSIACSRGGGEDGAQSRRLLSELLLQLTHQKQLQQARCSGAGNIAVIAATNRLADLDEAVIRRFDAKVCISLPELQQRQCLLEKYLAGIDHSLAGDDLLRVAHLCEGFSGSEIETLSREAAMAPLRAQFSYSNAPQGGAAAELRRVGFEDFSAAFCAAMKCGSFEEIFGAAAEGAPMA